MYHKGMQTKGVEEVEILGAEHVTKARYDALTVLITAITLQNARNQSTPKSKEKRQICHK